MPKIKITDKDIIPKTPNIQLVELFRVIKKITEKSIIVATSFQYLIKFEE